MREMIETRHAPAPIGPYAQAIRANGFIFVSGQIAVDPATGNVAAADIAGQTHQAMKNLSAILHEGGSGIEKIVKTTVFLTNLDDFPRFNEIYREYLGGTRPARSTVEVTRLPKGVLLEIEAVALT